MAYLTTLDWQRRLFEFDDNSKKVLLALSHEKYQWRTKERLVEVTGLSDTEVDKSLASLIEKKIVRPSFSKTRNLIFGLVERVG
jgi:hypothetical protein